MKSLAILIVFVYLAQVIGGSATESPLVLDSAQEECIKELKLNRATMASLTAQQFPPENNSDLNDLFSCAWKKQGYQKTNGDVDYDALEKMLFNVLKQQAGTSTSAIAIARQMASTTVNNCKTVRGKSPGEVAVKVQNCMYRGLL